MAWLDFLTTSLRRLPRRLLPAVAMAAFAATPTARAQTTNLTAVCSFPGFTDGSNPRGALVQGSDGNFYGTTATGGGAGAAFKITSAGGYTLLHRFTVADGANPGAGLVLGSDGYFYGTTGNGGAYNGGTVFRMTNAGVVTVLHSFNGPTEGSGSLAALVQGKDGNFYGTTYNGGTYGTGTVFKVTSAGVLTVLHTFTAFDDSSHNADGANPAAALVQGSDGYLYGTCTYAGSSNYGTVFQVNPSGGFSVFYSFTGGNDGGNPQGTLIQTSDGYFYGTAINGGANGGGVIFRFINGGAPTAVYSFASGSSPVGGIIRGNDGSFYGTTELGGDYADGEVFRLTTAGVYTTLHSFSGVDGNYPITALIQGSDGLFYGTAYSGGTNNDGAVFRVDAAMNFSTLHTFNLTNSGGANPRAGVVQGADGNFYGTTFNGGANNKGAVFKATPAGAVTAVHEFNAIDADGVNSDGASPYAGLTLGRDGSFYGVTAAGGSEGVGTMFKVASGVFSAVHSFDAGNTSDYTEGWMPEAALIQGSDGLFYGTTAQGGPYGNDSFGRGTVFKISAAGALTNLFTFNDSDNNGSRPAASLVQGSDGNFYGTTLSTAFQITAAGAITTLHSFGLLDASQKAVDGSLLVAGLVQGNDGAFYGMTSQGGANGYGLVFKVTAAKVFTALHGFTAAEGAFPQGGLILGSDGNFYGTTKYGGDHNLGTVFKMTPAGTLTVLGSFDGTQGAASQAGLIQGSDGDFYGTALGGGANGTGTVFVVRLAPAITSATTAAGQIGVAFSYQITATNTPTSYAASGLPTGLSVNAATGKITGTPSVAGTFTVRLTASNAFGMGTGTLTLTVANISPPVITSAGGVTGEVGSAFSYQITATNTPTSYAASGLPDGLSVNTGTGLISGTPTTGQYVTATVSATNAGGTGSAQVGIQIVPPTPVITSAPTATGTVGVAFSYQIMATNMPTSYEADFLPAGLALDTASGIISGVPTQPGTSNVNLYAENAGGITFARLTLTINNALSQPPVITSATSASAMVGTAFSYQITASNAPTGYGVSGLPDGLIINNSSGLISGTPTTAGSYTVILGAVNAAGSGTANLALTVAARPLQPPVITSPANAYAVAGAAFTYQVVASNTPTSYAVSGLPAGLGVDAASGLISGQTAQTGNFAVALSAVNAAGTGTGTLTLTIVAAPAGAPVTWATPGGVASDGDVSADSAFERAYVFARPDGTGPNGTVTVDNVPFSVFNADFSSDTLTAGGTTLHATGGQGTVGGYNGLGSTQSPFAGLSSVYREILLPGAYNDNGFLTLTVNNLTPGQLYEIEFFVNDSRAGATRTESFVAGNAVALTFNRTAQEGGTGQWVTGTFTADNTGSESVTVAPGLPNASGIPTAQINAFQLRALVADGGRPVVTSAGTASAFVGAAFSYQITATNNPTSFYTDGLPTGLSLDPTTGIISGVPMQAGTYGISFYAVNGVGSGVGVLTLTVSSAPPPVPVIVSPVTATAYLTQAFSYDIVADYATSFGAGGLPDGLTLDPATGHIAGTPITPGNYTVALTATDASGTGTANVAITVASPATATPVITSPASVAGQVGVPFAYQITGSNFPSQFFAANLPPGLNVNGSTGLISGVPTLAGTYYGTVVGGINNVGPGQELVTFKITAAAVPTPTPGPVIFAPVITSATTDSAPVGVPFTYQITAANSPNVYAAAGLPAGLGISALTGQITGTPAAAAGIYMVTLSAGNNAGTGTAKLALTLVGGGAPVITSAVTASGQDDVAFAFQIVATNLPTGYTASPLPAGLSVNPSTGLVSGVPNNAAGVYTVILGASNAGGTTTAVLTLTVAAARTTQPPSITVTAANNGIVTEGSGNAKLIFRRDGSTNAAVTVRYKIAGSARAGIDYKPMSGILIIPAGSVQAKLKLKPIDNQTVDGTRVAKVKLLPSTDGSYVLGSVVTAKVKIMDND